MNLNEGSCPPARGIFEITVDFPGPQDQLKDIHVSFDEWTLKFALEGPSEALGNLPSFRVLPETAEGSAVLRLRWANYRGESAWDAAKDAMEETLRVIAPDLIELAAAIQVSVVAEQLVPDPDSISDT